MSEFTPNNQELANLTLWLQNQKDKLKPTVWILSDFDETLCNNYQFDPIRNNHVPQIRTELAQAAQNANLMVATARSANDPVIAHIHQTLVNKPNVPIICENGGVIWDPQSQTKTVLGSRRLIDDALQNINPDQLGVPDNFNLFITPHDTSITFRVQDQDGHGQPIHHHKLAKTLQTLIATESISVVSSGSSVLVQEAHISKSNAFLHWLNETGIDRQSISIVGLGDAANDNAIFKEADLSVGVNSRVSPHVDTCLHQGEFASQAILSFFSNIK